MKLLLLLVYFPAMFQLLTQASERVGVVSIPRDFAADTTQQQQQQHGIYFLL